MSYPDARGNPCGSRSTAALAAAEQALWRMLSFYGPPTVDLEQAIAADPAWGLPHTMMAGHLLSLCEPGERTAAASHLAQARALSRHATARECAHVEAVQHLLDGRWHAACRVWDGLLIEHPLDALALWWAQVWDLCRGDAAGLRQRPARALPCWDEADPLYPHVLALHAFGLEECNPHAPAEDCARRALALDPRVPWAVHVVAHVMEMQGRFEAGSAWLRQQQAHWAEGNLYACHLWWHKSLFRLEAMDLAGAWRLADAHLRGDALQANLHRLDAASLLWRLHLLGEDVSRPCSALLEDWAPDPRTAGEQAFNDLHTVLTLVAADALPRAEAWVARCAERALDAADSGRANHLCARELGLPVMRGLLAYARGDFDGAADLIYPIRAGAQRLGGSHAQRDLIDLTLLAAAARGGRQALGRALVNERRMAKPVTPLTRHWIEKLSLPEGARA
jgi:hypothetical protein